MSVERTLAIIKPDAVAAGSAGQILARIEKAGFKVLALKMIRMSEDDAADRSFAYLKDWLARQ